MSIKITYTTFMLENSLEKLINAKKLGEGINISILNF